MKIYGSFTYSTKDEDYFNPVIVTEDYNVLNEINFEKNVYNDLFLANEILDNLYDAVPTQYYVYFELDFEHECLYLSKYSIKMTYVLGIENVKEKDFVIACENFYSGADLTGIDFQELMQLCKGGS